MLAKCKKCGDFIVRRTMPGEDKCNVLCEHCQVALEEEQEVRRAQRRAWEEGAIAGFDHHAAVAGALRQAYVSLPPWPPNPYDPELEENSK